MKKLSLLLFLSAVLAACVTINVYFPAAEAERAAQEFIDKVIGEETPAQDPQTSRFQWSNLFISSAHAQADLNIQTPAIKAIQARMAERFKSGLESFFAGGAIGLTVKGELAVRDATAVALKDRNRLNQLVAEDNRDRNAVYREIAVANGHPEWEQQIRETFARQWVEQARKGWYYQDASGAWKQK